jgi:putative ABC transport system permease protein
MAQMVYVDHLYLEQASDQAGWTTMYLVLPERPESADAVSAAIDAQFANFDVQTKTGPQKAFVSRMITDFKDMVGFAQIVAWAALLLLLAAVANSMSMTVRDRLREMAILKLMGFDSYGATRLVISEAVIASTVAAALGVLLAFLVVNGSGVAISIEGFSIVPQLSTDVVIWAIGLGALLGLLGAWWPARSGARLPIVQALREVD